jgi:hypothetical protein
MLATCRDQLLPFPFHGQQKHSIAWNNSFVHQLLICNARSYLSAVYPFVCIALQSCCSYCSNRTRAWMPDALSLPLLIYYRFDMMYPCFCSWKSCVWACFWVIAMQQLTIGSRKCFVNVRSIWMPTTFEDVWKLKKRCVANLYEWRSH